ncbi:MAG: hypothetical protein A2600_06370 [Candidatus Lambdaproteobacteria bacterium RIFOXYD1_FULL_56_27]|uniref:Uncharacterized protein n=1 Tax=Candidatus Lambdaproteobacteria bacterium RIFOXYD2_FULL_56_26 TaxID=1817773 RepID=A0A1F6H0K8_9PROT|nr:MAG: hypothetical protein A2426_00970 [Candidatus Lambdaproteobacteria bacterium RIFOXYC1_FULL_56_13]OGH03834.1 MAG: hypothetical protein A2557_11880 [Candidatus Lambdaproteobacteria bacterium RIFOXYD2_FULL_56_26]OGH08962.1 MAG: hypothetical protein A2600_06370 [Candidatus Lambdaproteobacteria bacterium RIFOXYD1_FULL_56_27]
MLLLVWEVYQLLELFDKVSNSLFGAESNQGINNSEVLVSGGFGDLKNFSDVSTKGLGVFFLKEPVPVPVAQAELLVDFDLGAGLKVVNPLVKARITCSSCLRSMLGTGYRPWAWSMVSPLIGAGRRVLTLRLLFIGFFIGFALEAREFFHPRFIPDSMQTLGVFPIVPDSFFALIFS